MVALSPRVTGALLSTALAVTTLALVPATASAAVPAAAAPAAALAAAPPAAVALAAARPAAAAAPPVLRLKSSGPAVRVLQRTLKVSPANGYFGYLTKRAVVAFQKRMGLPVTGVVGARTWAKLGTRASRDAARGAAPAAAAVGAGGKVCPTRNWSWGDGFGAGRGNHSHQGLDMMGSRGTPIYAVEAGVVIREGRQRNGALRIVLQGASGAKYFYGHMSRDLVGAGSRVSAGQVIGLMGDSGSPGAVHLHFEYWPSGRESAAVNPASFIRSVC